MHDLVSGAPIEDAFQYVRYPVDKSNMAWRRPQPRQHWAKDVF